MREMELMGAKAGAEQRLISEQVGSEKKKMVNDEDDEGSRNDEAPLLLPSALHNGSSATVAKADSLEEMEVKYGAYVRDDCYGSLGRGEVPVWEKVKLLLALLTIAPLRLALLLLILILYYIICRIFTFCRSPSDEEGQENYGYLRGVRRFVIVHSGRFLARLILFVLGFYWIEVTQPEEYCAAANPGAIVSNHVSYVDILYHMSASFPSFVAKRSVAKLPLVGLISKCLGCVYVQRESKTSDTKGVSGIVCEKVRAAHRQPGRQVMLLFPEGTTSNGKYLLPFKTGAFLSSAPVMPVILKYPYKRFSPAYESISGVRHIVLLFCQPINYLQVTRLSVYCPSEKEKAEPKLYAANVRALMAAQANLALSDIGLEEKRIYLNALRGTH